MTELQDNALGRKEASIPNRSCIRSICNSQILTGQSQEFQPILYAVFVDIFMPFDPVIRSNIWDPFIVKGISGKKQNF